MKEKIDFGIAAPCPEIFKNEGPLSLDNLGSSMPFPCIYLDPHLDAAEVCLK